MGDPNACSSLGCAIGKRPRFRHAAEMPQRDDGHRDHELVALVRHYRLLAENATEAGQHDLAAKLLAHANFFQDCIGTRVRRFRNRAANTRRI